MLDEGDTFRINGKFGEPEKKFSKANAKFCLSLHYNADNSYLFANGKKKSKFKVDNKILTFQFSFVWEVFLMDLVLTSLEIYLKMEMCIIFQSITISMTNLTY